MKTTSKEREYKKYLAVRRLAIQYRGAIIEDFSVIESYVELCIATYFCQDIVKRGEFLGKILGDVAYIFEQKLRTFEFIVTKNYPEFLEKYPKLISSIETIQRRRNIVAHRAVNKHDLANTKGDITFLQTEIKDFILRQKPFKLTKKEFEEILNDCHNLILPLGELYDLIKGEGEKAES